MRDVKIKLFIMFICCLGLMACGKGTEDQESLPTTTIDSGEYVYMPEFWELEGFYELLKHAVRGNSESMIIQIVIEEVFPFLSGQKTAEEVAAIIQSRVQLYLDENY